MGGESRPTESNQRCEKLTITEIENSRKSYMIFIFKLFFKNPDRFFKAFYRHLINLNEILNQWQLSAYRLKESSYNDVNKELTEGHMLICLVIRT